MIFNMDMRGGLYNLLINGEVKNVTPFYSGGMRSSNTEPAAAGTGTMLLNDALWNNDSTTDAANAKLIVQENTGIKTDAVVILTPAAVEAVINSVGPINVMDR